jgi:hypothetical protein
VSENGVRLSRLVRNGKGYFNDTPEGTTRRVLEIERFLTGAGVIGTFVMSSPFLRRAAVAIVGAQYQQQSRTKGRPRMKINARTATAADFDAAAQKHANAFWMYAIATAAVGYFWGWWGVIPGVLAAWVAISCVGAQLQARQLRAGTYRIPNPNNGAPDGDARNL